MMISNFDELYKDKGVATIASSGMIETLDVCPDTPETLANSARYSNFPASEQAYPANV